MSVDCLCFFDSSAILSVLQTPPVVHKTASLLRDAGPTVSVTKPQSILSAARHKTNAAASTAIRLTWDGTYMLMDVFCYRALNLVTCVNMLRD